MEYDGPKDKEKMIEFLLQNGLIKSKMNGGYRSKSRKTKAKKTKVKKTKAKKTKAKKTKSKKNARK